VVAARPHALSKWERSAQGADMRSRSRGAWRPGFGYSFHAPPEGSRAPTGAGAEAPHPVTLLAVGSISENAQRSPANDGGRRASRRSAAAFSLRRRAALSSMAQRAHRSSAKLLAGGRSASGRSPAAARVRTVRGSARGRRTGEGPELPGARHRSRRLFSGASFNSSRLTTPHDGAPQRTRFLGDKPLWVYLSRYRNSVSTVGIKSDVGARG